MGTWAPDFSVSNMEAGSSVLETATGELRSGGKRAARLGNGHPGARLQCEQHGSRELTSGKQEKSRREQLWKQQQEVSASQEHQESSVLEIKSNRKHGRQQKASLATTYSTVHALYWTVSLTLQGHQHVTIPVCVPFFTLVVIVLCVPLWCSSLAPSSSYSPFLVTLLCVPLWCSSPAPHWPPVEPQ